MVALARRSPRARLYSLVPRSSQCPSISTRLLALDLSHDALASSVLASSARMSYLSKSKYTSLRFALSANSRGRGGVAGAAVAGAAVAGAGEVAEGLVLPPVLGAAGVGCTPGEAGAIAAPVGAGAAAAVIVAGRLGQPVTSRVRARRGSRRCRVPRRCGMISNPPLASRLTRVMRAIDPITEDAATMQDLPNPRAHSRSAAARSRRRAS